MNADLARYSPWLRYDSQESFRADSAATLTDSVGKSGPNVLKRKSGTVLAAAGKDLTLDLLGSATFKDGQPAKKDDFLDAVGRDYVTDARRLHANPAYADRIYGHVAKDSKGATWLQYWFFYYYNDKQFLGLGLHEGDWEMIQLRLGTGGAPDVVTYAQHDGGERCSWAGVEKGGGGAPIVYVARGSHASLLRRGRHDAPMVPDECDAKGPLIRPALEELTAPWAAWPGFWGSTRAGSPLESSSPNGPSQHKQYKDPLTKHNAAKDCQLRAASALTMATVPAPPRPRLAPRAEDGHAVVEWRMPASPPGTPAAATLVLSLDSKDDDLPPATYHAHVEGQEGTETLPPALAPGHHYVVLGRSVSDKGIASEPVSSPVAGT
jgi:hypothetical protein